MLSYRRRMREGMTNIVGGLLEPGRWCVPTDETLEKEWLTNLDGGLLEPGRWCVPTDEAWEEERSELESSWWNFTLLILLELRVPLLWKLPWRLVPADIAKIKFYPRRKMNSFHYAKYLHISPRFQSSTHQNDVYILSVMLSLYIFFFHFCT